MARWMPRRPYDPRRAQTWKTFLENHQEVISAMDFLVVPTWNFRLLYVLVILDHGRRVIRHVGVTAHPTAEWVGQHLRHAFPFDEVPTYLLFDRDAIFRATRAFVEALGITPKQISFRSPWQNGYCERVIGTLRRDFLDHVVVRDEAHLTRLLKDYLCYYHEDRTHLGLNKDSPSQRPIEAKTNESAKLVAVPRCGGLHHRYRWVDAAKATCPVTCGSRQALPKAYACAGIEAALSFQRAGIGSYRCERGVSPGFILMSSPQESS